MTNPEWPALLADAHAALRTAVAGVSPDAWQLPTPCERWTVAQVYQHAVGDQLGYAAFLDGGPFPSADPFAPTGDLDDDPVGDLENALQRSAKALSTVDIDAVRVANPLPQGPLPAWVVGGACALDAAVHAWDIAVATGGPSPLTPHLAGQLLAVAREIVEPLRAYGAYGPALEVSGGDEVTAVLGYLGRSADWRP